MASVKIFQWDSTLLSHSHINIQSHTRGLFLLLIFFSLLVLVTTFSLCAHRMFGQRLLSTAADALVNATPTPSLGLDPRTINRLPVILHTKSEGKLHGYIEETECSICLGVFEDEEVLKVLPQCKHAYHSQCVDKWLGSRSSCPLCRASLAPITSP